jgi:hypothetical protein
VAVDEAAGVDFMAAAAERISAVEGLAWAAAPISGAARAWAVELISEAALASAVELISEAALALAVAAHVSVVRTSAAGLR